MNPLRFALRALGIALLVHAAPSGADELASSDRIATPNGVARLTGPSFHRAKLSVDGKLVFEGPGDVLELWRDYDVAGSDAVLFSSDCSGSGCGQRHFYFALLKRGSRPQVVTTPDFLTTDGHFDLPHGHDGVVVELGFEHGFRKWAQLNGQQVRIHLDPSDARISAEDCERVHRMALEGCSKVGPADTCEPRDPTGSHADLGMLASLSNAPGFDSTALRATCQAQCATGAGPSLDTFKKVVCALR